MVFVRLFIVPIGITLSMYLFTNNIDTIKSGIMIFALSFFFNWIADRVLVERMIDKKKDNDKT